MLSHMLPCLGMKSLYGSITRSAVISLLYVCLAMVSLRWSGWIGQEFRFIASRLLSAAPVHILAVKRSEAGINNLILTHVAVSSWLSTFGLQGAYRLKTKSRALTIAWQEKQVLCTASLAGLPSSN